MSQYLTISLRKKDKPTLEVSLWWVSTTTARRMSSEINAFPCTQEDKLLDSETFFGYLNSIKQYVNEQKEIRKSHESELEMLIPKLPSATSKEVYEALKEDIFDLKSTIENFDECIRLYSKIFEELKLVWNIYVDNDEEWDIYYSNC